MTDKQFITGFAEGDGHVGVRNTDLTIIVSFSQQKREVLDYISSLYSGGHLYLPHHQKDNWRLYYAGTHCYELLRTFSKYVVGESFLEGLNTALVRANLLTTVTHKPSTAWLAGFWYADGTCSSTNAFFHLSLSQKAPSTLEAVQRTFGGSIYKTARNILHWKPEATTRVSLALEFLKFPHLSEKAERLRRNLILTGHLPPRNKSEECEVYELRKDHQANERERQHSEDSTTHEKRLTYQREYAKQHREQRQAYNKQEREQRCRVREYIKEHSEVVAQLPKAKESRQC